ncbi:MAG: class I SAM-dependent methyltransferase [Candidatus Tenebribacter burtonii]|jgi:23S rRNA (cytosine1962-C5)-methyltransferase|nr:class I SAM-dependent methyltransferase [Candidatus Tenebribacter burtonii]
MKDLVKCNYTLLDCGNFEKLEQVGEVIIRRPALQAAWKRKLGNDIWQQYHAKFDPLQDKWIIFSVENLPYFECDNLTFELKISPNQQIGIFPEQFTNWQWLRDVIFQAYRPLNILNGFAYTGASTLFASTKGTTLTHIDASSSSINWAKQNCRLSNLENNNIRWIIDDIISFLSREVKRGSVYDGIILDPPAFGHGKKGTTWKIGRDLPKLMKLVDKLLSNDPEFIILSCHDKNFGHLELRNELTKLHNLKKGKIETFDLTIKSESGNNLPAGKCVRWKKLN